MTLPHSVICIERMDIPSRGMFLVAVALSSNHVLIYNDKNVVDCFKTDDAVSAMKFGRFGREENTLVIGHLYGSMSIVTYQSKFQSLLVEHSI